MSSDPQVPDTRVLAIASHVVYGYVGNTMAAFVMQSLGCEVAALNTVQFSNHSGYRQMKGTRTSAAEITDIYQGLKDSFLDDFSMMLSGYIPSAAAVNAVGSIARELKLKATMKPGSFFWILDPVMGDNGKLYVAEDILPAYKSLVRDADLILPNQYEAEWLSGVKIVDLESLSTAITSLHTTYRIPHVIITSIRFPGASETPTPHLSVVGSTMTSTGAPRIWKIDIPAIDCYFSGTGDMFAALVLVRLREAVARIPGLGQTDSWVSGDDVDAPELPCARAAELALASMQVVLVRTKEARDKEVEGLEESRGHVDPEVHDVERSRFLRRTKAAEVRLVRNLDCLRDPEVKYKAEKVEFQSS